MNNHKLISTFLLGNNLSYILFKAAIHFAEAGLNVWYIAPESFTRIPDNIKPPAKEILQLITFMYLKDYKDLITHLNGIHLWHKIPNMIILSGFEKYSSIYLDDYNPSKAALIITNILDSGLSCAIKKNNKTFILITCEEPEESQNSGLQVLKDLYFHKVIHKTDDNTTIDNIIATFQ